MDNDFQPLLTGIIAGLLLQQDVVDISVAPVIGKDGNYLPKIVVRSNRSGEAVVISVEALGSM